MYYYYFYYYNNINGGIDELEPQDTKCIIDELLITPEIVAKNLPNLNPAKSPGYDGLLIKEARNELSHPVCIIYNNSLDSESLYPHSGK